MSWNVTGIKDWQTITREVRTIQEYIEHYGIDPVDYDYLWEHIKDSQYWIFEDDSVEPGNEQSPITREMVTKASVISRRNPVTDWLVNQGLPQTGFVEITKKNYIEVYKRCRIMGRLYSCHRPQTFTKGEGWEYRNITLIEIKDHIGLWSPLGKRTEARFWKDIREDLERWANRNAEEELNKTTSKDW